MTEGLKLEMVRADMNKFKLGKKVDFAYIMMGSIMYTKNNELFLSHLDSVADSLRSGGLYLVENLTMNWSDPKFLKSQSWTMRKNGTKVRTIYRITPKDPLKQIVSQSIVLEVDDNGEKKKFTDQMDLKVVFPEEFKLLIEKNGKFEFIGFFEREKVKLLKNISSNNIALLRRR